MSTLITGASGFIGGHIQQPNDFRLVRRQPISPYERQGDLSDSSSLNAACRQVKAVIHCAGYAHAFGSTNTAAHWEVNFRGTKNLIEAAHAQGVSKFVYLSSVKAMADPGASCADESWPGTPDSDYGQSKRAAEDFILNFGSRYGMHVVVLRLAMVYGRGSRGNLERMARGIESGWFPPLPETGNRRSMVHVDDVVHVSRQVLSDARANSKTYIIAHPETHSGRGLQDAIRGCLGGQSAQKPQWQVPEWLLRGAGVIGQTVGNMTHRSFPINTEVVSRLLDSAWYSHAKIKAELGWEASVNLAEGLRRTLQAPTTSATAT